MFVYWLHISSISICLLMCFGARFHNGTYTIIVRIDKSLEEKNQTEILNLVKLMFIRASEFLHVATNQLTSFEEIIIILPFNSGNTSAQQLWNSVEKSDILIVQKPTIYPYTQQSQGCRHPGDIINIPLSYVQVSPLKLTASSLLDNWIRLRYGVFEEHGWEKDDLYPDIYWESGQMKLTQCINKYMTNETPFPAYSTDEIHLCNNESHNYNAPTRQNVLCSYRSIWDVMMEHDDFQNNLKPHQYLQPKFKIMKQAQLHVVFIIDASHHYHSMLLQFQQAMAFLILNELPKHTLVTLIEHKEGNAELLLKLTEITDMQSREDFLYTLPNEPNGQPNLEAALIIADKVYKNHSKYQTVFYIPIFGKFEGASQIDKFKNVEIFFFFTNPFRISTYPKYDSANINNINNIVLPEAKNIGKSLNHALNKILHQYYPNTQHTITIINELYTKGKTYNFYTETDTDELIVTIVSTVLDSIQEVVLIPPINSPILLTHSEMCTQDLSRRIATCRVLQPESGLWRLAIISDDSLQDIIVDITVKCTSCVSVQSWLSMSHIIKTSTRDLPFIYAQLSSPTKFLNATVIAHVKHAPTRKQKSIELIDNGKDPDIIKADNIYTAILSPLKEAGWYYITISINVTKEASVSKYLHLQRQVLTGSIYLDERIPDDSSMRYPTRVLDLHIDVSTTEQDVILLQWTNNKKEPVEYDIRWSKNINLLIAQFNSITDQIQVSEQDIYKKGNTRQIQLPFADFKSSFCFAIKLRNRYKISGRMSNIACMSHIKPISVTSSKVPAVQWVETNSQEVISSSFLAMAIALGVCVLFILAICITVIALLNQCKLVKKRGNIDVEEKISLRSIHK